MNVKEKTRVHYGKLESVKILKDKAQKHILILMWAKRQISYISSTNTSTRKQKTKTTFQ